MPTIDLTVCTPSIPGRGAWLAQAIASVEAQRVKPLAHVIRVDGPGGLPGVVRARRALAEIVGTKWMAGLDDDDVLLGYHFETLQTAMENEVGDVIYTYDASGQGTDLTNFSTAQLVEFFDRDNCVPVTACIRMEAFSRVGGWSDEGFDPDTHLYGDGPCFAEDWDLWRRMAAAGARFVCLPVPTYHRRDGAPHRLIDQARERHRRREGQ